MVNYRRVVCEVAALVVVAAVAAAAPAPDCTHAHTHYDQRQNGSENYRLNIDGVVIAVAPAETLMSALGDMDDLLDLALEEYNQDYPVKPPQSSSTDLAWLLAGEKPQKPVKPQEEKPQEDKPAQEKPEVKPQGVKPEDEKPQEVKPEDEKPQEVKPEEPKPEAPLSDVSLSSDEKSQKKDASIRKHEKAQRLKNRLATFLAPLLRKNRHQ